MIRDSKLSRRNSGKNLNLDETENVPVNVNIRESSIRRMSIDSCSRPPLNSIQEPLQNPSKPAQESGFKSSKTHRTPTKAKIRHHESATTMRTPEKQGVLARDRFGWGHDSTLNTPRSCRTSGRASLGFPDLNSTHTTPTKSVTKPPNPGFTYGGNSRPPLRTGNFAALSKGIPVTSNNYTTVNTIQVPHFDLREDPSFWMDHNVQVLIRIRPLNGMEISSQGYNRCLKQESAQSLTWIGNPETRFTFDHVACETIDQETLFKMVGQPMVENCLSGYNSCMFAYGQTGSGKTHTMLGEINNLELKPSQYRGMTPRIFEFLFSRIIVEEGSRKNERLTYNCKCSFLEIYNEQITDLLDPSSTNLQLREDVKKGVYVENLTEFEVHTVGDILRLLRQGSSNRRVASTNMNKESSRSHSVFTCVIESRWEKDSTSNLRFARLNLVDLAGSERQKSSGAEGERLKEAANINKSLSTLGHVIMVLVDGANARTRHVPYRDSRLTFLLQDSLGGNSKTMIIANVSPSISSATETLNTLKFAQRAKLIQNNAVINEDASGDVEALQHQIRLLKEEVATLKRLNITRSLTYNSRNENCSNLSSLDNYEDDEKVIRVSCKQLKSSLNGALRREQSTENSIKQLEAEIEQLNSLVGQREEENRCTKMMLKFREEKIQRMECVLSGSLTVDSYLLEENKMVNEEIKILRGKVDRNPEVTRFAVENIRLLEQLRRFEDFYEEGEREMLLSEVSELRDQLVLFLDQNSKQDDSINFSIQMEGEKDKKEDDFLQLELKKSREELEKCRVNLNTCLEKNAQLCRENSDLNGLLEMKKSGVHDHDGGIKVIKESIPTIDDHAVEKHDEILEKDTKQVMELELEVEILKIILKEERLTRGKTEEEFLIITKQCENFIKEVQEAKSVIEDLNNSNNQYIEILREKELEITCLNDKIKSQVSQDAIYSSNHKEKLNKVQNSLEKAKILNNLYQNDQKCHADNEEEMDKVRKQVEVETTQVIVCLQEEIGSFQERNHETQQELAILKEKLDVMTECNKRLMEKCEEKDRELYGLSKEIEEVLNAGHMALDDALNYGHGKRTLVSDKLQIIARNINEKELRIHELNSCLEDAKSKGNEMESMLRSLRGAILVMSEAHQQDCIKKDEEIGKLKESLEEKDFAIEEAEKEIQSLKVESCCYLDKFVETDFMIKEMKKKEFALLNERESYSIIEQQIETDTMKMNEQVKEIESMILEIQATIQDFVVVPMASSDFNDIKSCFHDLLTWHQEIRCEMIANFEKKIFDVKVMEEEIMKKIDESHQKQQVINEKDEEKIMIDLCAKEIELFVMLSKMEETFAINNDLENEKNSMCMVVDKFKEDMIVSFMEIQLKDLILLEKIDLLEKDIALKYENEMNERLLLKDHKHEIEEFEASFEDLECELYENVVKSHVFETHLKENVKCLEIEILHFKTVVDENNSLIESLKKDLKNVGCEKDEINGKFLEAMKDVENAKAIYEEKEEELKVVYEKSVEELECTVNVLENQVEMVKRESERQRLQREELQQELHAFKHQIHNDSKMQRELDEKEKELQDLLRRNIILEKEINELKVEATEYNNQTFKSMETRTPDMTTSSPYKLNSPFKKLDGNGSRSRDPGSISPFKCMKLGFVQQMKCEKDEDLISATIRIQELESLLASRQMETEIDNLKKKVMELEAKEEQNLQQHIDHLAKIKEENNMLKAQNDEISHKMKRAELVISRVKEELPNLRARNPC